MDIQLDDKTIERLSTLAALQNTSAEKLAAEWVRKTLIDETIKAEDMSRLDNVRKNGGIPHNEMMDWLDELAAGKNV